MKTTNYHDDARGPAVCVKCYNVARDVPADSTATEEQHGRAWEEAGRAWWNRAAKIARAHGFRDVYAAGRMGGWLYTDPLPEAEYPAAFLEDLGAWLKRAPDVYADILADTIERDAADAAAEAERAAAVPRLALALVDTARSVAYAADALQAPERSAMREGLAVARAALAAYADTLRGRDLTEPERAALAAIRGGDA